MATKINGLTKPKFKKGDKVYVDAYGLGWVEKCILLDTHNIYFVKFGELTMGGIMEEWMVKC